MVPAYYRRLTSENELEQIQAAKAWAIWEGRCATLHPNPSVVEHFGHPHVAISLARIECHYFMNDSFLEPDQIIRNADRLAGIPGFIVHGRYDMVCPLDNATALSEAWPEAELAIIRDAGHSAGEPAIVDALMLACHQMAEKLRPDFPSQNRMKGLIQRVRWAEVQVEQVIVGRIGQGLLLFLGIEKGDSEALADRLLERVLGYRVFSDREDRMNLSLADIAGDLLVVSQFTLAADTRKGRRPSFSSAAAPDEGQRLYDYFLRQAASQVPVTGGHLAHGQFGADMQVSLCNDGPVTFLLES